MIVWTIKQNFADIYFDFNDPIRTNDVYHTIGIPTDLTSSLESNPVYQQKQIVVIPNPFNNRTTFYLNQAVNNGQLSIYDVLGRVVHTQKVSGSEVQFEQIGLSNGMYFYSIDEGLTNFGQGKIIVEK